MNLTLRTAFGSTEAIIDDDCGLKRFYEVARLLTQELKIQFIRKVDDFDTMTWDFNYNNHPLCLHYNIYTGISIFPQKTGATDRTENDAVVELAAFVENKLLVHSVKRILS